MFLEEGGQENNIIEIIRIYTCETTGNPRAEPFRARSMGMYLVGHHPVRSKGGDLHRPGLNATSTFLCPRSSGLTPRLPLGYLLSKGLLQ